MSAGNSSRIHHFKLVLLGDTAVGKSCLVVRFVRDEFFEFQEPTIGGTIRLARAKRKRYRLTWKRRALEKKFIMKMELEQRKRRGDDLSLRSFLPSLF